MHTTKSGVLPLSYIPDQERYFFSWLLFSVTIQNNGSIRTYSSSVLPPPNKSYVINVCACMHICVCMCIDACVYVCVRPFTSYKVLGFFGGCVDQAVNTLEILGWTFFFSSPKQTSRNGCARPNSKHTFHQAEKLAVFISSTIIFQPTFSLLSFNSNFT